MTRLTEIKHIGQSLWYDNIERSMLLDGSIKTLIEEGKISGITSNPSIFQKAIASSNDYDNTLKPMAWAGLNSQEIFWQLAIEDITHAAGLFSTLYQQTNQMDGFVSLEVDPQYAYDTGKTVGEALRIWKLVNRPNLMIKIPATREGVPAIRECLAAGININVTLIFSMKRYEEVIEAFLAGLEDRVARGEAIDHISSVASFFVSRIDTKIDARLKEKLDAGEIPLSTYNNLAGKAAIANARLAYQFFKEKFNSPRFEKLKTHGAQVQRPLWASTSTKNPAYRDVMYVEELIAPQTINTLPPVTLEAFLYHGRVEVAIENDLPASKQLIEDLAEQGISLDQVTSDLEEEGVETFSRAIIALLDTVEQRRKLALDEIGTLDKIVKSKVSDLKTENFSLRLADKDTSLWTTGEDHAGQKEIRQRMGWIEAPYQPPEELKEYSEFTGMLLKDGFTHALLLGMGGSSLAPEVINNIQPRTAPGLKLLILDSTDPQQIEETTNQTPAMKTVYIVASKSGTTGEINSLFEYFWKRTVDAGAKEPGKHFIAVTDPGTPLAELANARGFNRLFTANPNVGGRNSALTAFGLVPAAIVGADLNAMLQNARQIAGLCSPAQPVEANPGVVLGAIIGAAAKLGKNKVTLIAENEWNSFGDWLEQLIAESSGKEGKGILPVTNEPMRPPDDYTSDRFFVYLNRKNSKTEFMNELRRNGHPAITLSIKDNNELAGQFYLWEIAIATACSVIGVNSFDQPDVQDAKTRTLAGIASFKQTGRLDEPKPVANINGLKVMTGLPEGDVEFCSLDEVLAKHLENNRKIDYIAINAFLPKNEANESALNKLRGRIAESLNKAVTLGFGPRYLHSTGQFHKGGPNSGLFLLVTARRSKDIEIPEAGITFGIMQRAQAIGDYHALLAKGREVIWLDLEEPDARILLEL